MKALPKYGQIKVESKEPEVLLWSTDKKTNNIISNIFTFLYFCVFIAMLLWLQFYLM